MALHPIYEYLRVALGAESIDATMYPPDILFADERAICLLVSERGGVLTLNEIEAWPLDTGLGTALMEAVRVYITEHSLRLRLRDVTAPGFFDRFPWLNPQETGEVTEGRCVVDYWG